MFHGGAKRLSVITGVGAGATAPRLRNAFRKPAPCGERRRQPDEERVTDDAVNDGELRQRLLRNAAMRQHQQVHEEPNEPTIRHAARHREPADRRDRQIRPGEDRRKPARETKVDDQAGERGCEPAVKGGPAERGCEPAVKGGPAERAARDILEHLHRIEVQRESEEHDAVGCVEQRDGDRSDPDRAQDVAHVGSV